MLLNRLLYFILFISSGCAIYFFDGPNITGLFYLLLILPFICLLHILLSVLFIRVDMKLDENFILKGSEPELRIKLQNSSPFPLCSYRLVFKSSAPFLNNCQFTKRGHSLGCLEDQIQTLTLPAVYWGRYQVRLKYIEYRDLLGLFKIRLPHSKPLDFHVHPRMTPFVRPDLIPSDIRHDAPPKSFSPFQRDAFQDIRDYHPGDHRRDLHWKMWAKYLELKVKNYQGEKSPLLTLLVDNYSSNATPLDLATQDHIIEGTLSLCQHFFNKKGDIAYIDADGIPHFYQWTLDFQNLYNTIDATKFTSAIDPLSLRLLHYIESQQYGMPHPIACMTSTLDDALLSSVATAVDRGYPVYLFLTLEDESAYESALNQAGEYVQSPDLEFVHVPVHIPEKVGVPIAN